MWRRLSTHLRTLTPSRSAPKPNPHIAGNICASPSPFRPAASLFSRHFTTPSDNVVSKKKVEDVMPIATGHEREELQAELEGRNILDIDFPEGPFGTKESPAVVKSYYDKRIVGCPGVEGEDEHDVVWFWLEKGKPHECPVCSQYLCWKLLAQEDLQMGMAMMIITNCSFRFPCWNKIW